MTTPSYAEVSARLQARWPESRISPTLERVRRLTELLGDPQRGYPVIHLTGTNGKTSTARMIDALLREAGLRTGRFTSPHLETVRERITLDGEPISEERFTEAYLELEPYIELVDTEFDVPLSFFEVITVMAFAVFADAPVDVAVIEVGLGGTWDSTNVADGIVSVITPVAVDHSHLLGTEPVEIAMDKAGIIKAGATAVMSLQTPEVFEVLMRRAAEVGATYVREGFELGVLSREIAVGGQLLTLRGLGGEYSDVFLPLHGEHQARNAVTALGAVEAFVGATEGKQVDQVLVRRAFSGTSSPGRLEVVRHSPAIVLDAAHNPAGAQATAASIGESFTFAPLVGVIGCMADKDVYGVLEAFEPVMDFVVCTQNSTPRAMPAAELGAEAEEVFGEDRVFVVPRLDDAIDEAVRLAEERTDELGAGGVLVTGSVITAGEARLLLTGGRS